MKRADVERFKFIHSLIGMFYDRLLGTFKLIMETYAILYLNENCNATTDVKADSFSDAESRFKDEYKYDIILCIMLRGVL